MLKPSLTQYRYHAKLQAILQKAFCLIAVSTYLLSPAFAADLLAPAANMADADAHIAETLTVSFQKTFEQVVDDAQAYVKANKKRHSAVVLDLDETLLDNRAYYVQYKIFTPDNWHQWMLKGEAPALQPSLEFVQWLNKKHVKVFFISGRLESERQITEENLKKIGVNHYAKLYLRPDNYSSASMKNFKKAVQEEIQKQGEHILLFLGDQDSDMRSALGKGFKLPNPIYTVP